MKYDIYMYVYTYVYTLTNIHTCIHRNIYQNMCHAPKPCLEDNTYKKAKS